MGNGENGGNGKWKMENVETHGRASLPVVDSTGRGFYNNYKNEKN
ncbi:MAG: hypothetical protein PHQ11_05400 [Paludibacter sp.]|nr:hypothetical protein [Paludibacter sp.]MDD4198447.1 hypothetical protein [Paludibacter sp.]MDD4427717.1 hypothetical protein [Paludibacter sp.]